jgi:hypothetical protein
MLSSEEQTIFDSFYKILPDFAGRPVCWSLGNNPPDNLCIDSIGKRVGVELTAWLNEEQIKASKDREKLQDSYLKAIRSEQVAPPTNIGFILLKPKQGLSLKKADEQCFHEELYSFIEEIDSNWHELKYRGNPQGYSINKFSKYPCLEQYLDSLRLFPRSRLRINPKLGIPWIRFPVPGGSYTPQTAINALLFQINKKTKKYENLYQEQKLDKLFLVVYYSYKAIIHNSPFDGPGFGFRQVVDLVAQEVQNNHGVFSKIFLFNAVKSEEEVMLIWPQHA